MESKPVVNAGQAAPAAAREAVVWGVERAVLLRLLDRAAAWDPEYGGGLSNHQPMALLALARLGANEARLIEFGAAYAADKKLVPARPREPWPAGEAWARRFGNPGAWPLYLDLFERWIEHESAADVLAQALPALMPGVAAAAFHGLIRTAAAVQAGHAGEVAQGLAHWAAFFLPLGPTRPRRPAAAIGAGASAARRALVSDPAAVLRKLRAGTSMADTIAARMADAAASGCVDAAAARLLIDDSTPERLARAAALAYAESGNFTALHLVTGTHAMRMLAPFVDEGAPRLEAWRCFWQAFANGVVAARLQVAPQPLVVRSWPDLVAAALAARDEHVIKLVDAAREEERCYGGDDWRRAASRAVMGQ